MDNKELNFYKRQINLPNFGLEGQKKLSKSKIIVVGVGGLGSPAILFLAAAGIGKIGICDFDKVDVTNLHRQIIFDYEQVGKEKTNSAEEQIKKLNPFVNIEKINSAVSPKNVESIISDYDVVLDCTDNFSTKFLIHDACFLNKINLVQSSIYQFEGQLQIFRFAENTKQGCYRCLWPNIPKEGCVGTCANSGVLGVVPGIFGTLQALETIKIILGWKSLNWNESLIFDLLSLNSRKIKWKKKDNCPLCGDNKRIKQIKSNEYLKVEDFELSCEDVDLKKYKLVDIRESFERVEDFLNDESLNIEHIPYSTLQNTLPEINEEEQYLFYCRSGRRTYELVSRLRANNFSNTFSLVDGITALLKILESKK